MRSFGWSTKFLSNMQNFGDPAVFEEMADKVQKGCMQLSKYSYSENGIR